VGGFDDYTLAGDPAIGPMGSVSWATHRPSGRAVAVTELTERAASNQSFVARLRATAAALAGLGDPNVLPIREVVEGSTDDGSPRVWVVEDWVDGRELGEVLADGPLTAEQSLSLACGVLRGLVAVQAHGVVHGDVTPATIVIGAGGVPQLVGFGFAGIPGGPTSDAAGDVLAVAVVVRDLLAGAHKKLDAALDRATSAKPRRRPADAGVLLAILEKAARSDLGKRWETETSLAPLAVAPPAPAAGPGATPPAALDDEARVVPAEVTQELEPDESAVPADPGPPIAVPTPDPAGAFPDDTAPATDGAPDGDSRPATDGAPDGDSGPATDGAPDGDATRDIADPGSNGAESATADAAPGGGEPDATEPEAVVPAPVPQDLEPVASRVAGRAPAAKKRSTPTPARAPAAREPTPAPASDAWGARAPVAPAPPVGAGPERGPRSRRGRRPQPKGVVRVLTCVLLILLGAGAATAVERIQADGGSEDSAAGADSGGADSGGAPTAQAPTKAEIATADITGTWAMKLIVVESTGFFGTAVGSSVDKTYTITSECSAAPCVLELAVSEQPGKYTLRQEGEDYVLSASGPNDCIDLPTGVVRVPNGGVASVQVHLRPTGATRTPRGDWAATSLTGFVVTTFDTSDPVCVQGSGLQRSTVVGTRG